MHINVNSDQGKFEVNQLFPQLAFGQVFCRSENPRLAFLLCNWSGSNYVMDLSAGIITSVEKFRSENTRRFFVIPNKVSLELHM